MKHRGPQLKRSRRDKWVAFFLIAPSMTLILLIAIWPVIQSFYFSLFDLRLNDPTRSSVNWHHRIDLERYLNHSPFLIGALDQEIGKSEATEELHSIKQQLEALVGMTPSMTN